MQSFTYEPAQFGRLAHRAVLAVALSAASAGLHAQQQFLELDELAVIVEINATDGDVGFHMLADADSWRWLQVIDPDNQIILEMRALGSLREQGMTENFFESAEPLCEEDDEEPDERVVALAEFVDRFAAGEYFVRANTLEGDRLRGTTELTWNLPAAPDISMTEDAELDIANAVLIWAPGDDLGESCTDDDLVADGSIADPAAVEVEFWEVVVEVDEDDALELVFSAQVPADQTMVTVPMEFLAPFVEAGFDTFKFEIGAIEESGNRTFSEGEFEIIGDDG